MQRSVDALDTTREARALQTARWRSMTTTGKLQVVAALCCDVERIARLGIKRDHPDASEAEVLHHLAARRFGSSVADAAFPFRG